MLQPFPPDNELGFMCRFVVRGVGLGLGYPQSHLEDSESMKAKPDAQALVQGGIGVLGVLESSYVTYSNVRVKPRALGYQAKRAGCCCSGLLQAWLTLGHVGLTPERDKDLWYTCGL